MIKRTYDLIMEGLYGLAPEILTQGLKQKYESQNGNLDESLFDMEGICIATVKNIVADFGIQDKTD